MTFYIFCCILWILFAMSDGSEEARIFHYRGVDVGNDEHIHKFFTAQRITVGLSFLGVILWEQSAFKVMPWWAVSGFWIFFTMASFAFVHNGTYFQVRKWMDDRLDYHFFYPKSLTSNAKINMTVHMRTWLFGAAIVSQMAFIDWGPNIL